MEKIIHQKATNTEIGLLHTSRLHTTLCLKKTGPLLRFEITPTNCA